LLLAIGTDKISNALGSSVGGKSSTFWVFGIEKEEKEEEEEEDDDDEEDEEDDEEGLDLLSFFSPVDLEGIKKREVKESGENETSSPSSDISLMVGPEGSCGINNFPSSSFVISHWNRQNFRSFGMNTFPVIIRRKIVHVFGFWNCGQGKTSHVSVVMQRHVFNFSPHQIRCPF